MNILKVIVWIVVIAVVVWVGYIFINKKSVVPAVQEVVPVVETVVQPASAPSPSGALPVAPAPTVIPAPAPAPSVTPPAAPAPKANY